MTIIGNILVGLVALLHVYFMILEMFLWTTPKGLKTFGQTLEKAQDSAVLAANQGLYNGFLAAGLIYSLFAEPIISIQFKFFFLICVMIAGLYGAYTANKRILFVQAMPATLAIVLLLLG